MQNSIAGALLIAENSDMLLQLRDNKPGVFSPGMISIFGGHVEAGETFHQAAHREIIEETGLDITPDDLQKLVKVTNNYPNGSVTLGEFYVIEGVGAEKMSITEGSLIRIPQEQLAKHMFNIVPTTLFVIAQYLSMKN